MTKISRKNLGSAERAIIKDFWAAMNALTDAERITFFSRVFTPTEIKMFAKRLAVLKALKMGKLYDEIRAEYAVMPNTIGVMSNIIHRSGDEVSTIIQKLIALSLSKPKKARRNPGGRVYGSRSAVGTKRILGF